MEDFQYKEYTAEENEVYNAAMAKIMEGLRKGLGFNEACSAVDVEDRELKGFIEDDAMKIIIAEMHYMQGLSLPEVASALKVSIEPVNKANLEMLEDVEVSSTEFYRQNNPDKPIGNA